jgi:hypothetical protein
MLIGPTLRTPANLSKERTSFVPNVVAATHNLRNSTTAAVDSTKTRRPRTASGGAGLMGLPGSVGTHGSLVSCAGNLRFKSVGDRAST